MGKRKTGKQRILLAVLLLSLSLAGAGCGDDEQAKVPDTSREESGKTISKAGLMSHGFFLEEDGIVVSSGEHFLYSDWEPVEFDYICMDPTCSHLNEIGRAHV